MPEVILHAGEASPGDIVLRLFVGDASASTAVSSDVILYAVSSYSVTLTPGVSDIVLYAGEISPSDVVLRLAPVISEVAVSPDVVVTLRLFGEVASEPVQGGGTVHAGQASVNGAASVNAGAVAIRMVAASITGSASVLATASAVAPGTSIELGTCQITAAGSAFRGLASNATGSGSITASGNVGYAGQATTTGTGSLSGNASIPVAEQGGGGGRFGGGGGSSSRTSRLRKEEKRPKADKVVTIEQVIELPGLAVRASGLVKTPIDRVWPMTPENAQIHRWAMAGQGKIGVRGARSFASARVRPDDALAILLDLEMVEDLV